MSAHCSLYTNPTLAPTRGLPDGCPGPGGPTGHSTRRVRSYGPPYEPFTVTFVAFGALFCTTVTHRGADSRSTESNCGLHSRNQTLRPCRHRVPSTNACSTCSGSKDSTFGRPTIEEQEHPCDVGAEQSARGRTLRRGRSEGCPARGYRLYARCRWSNIDRGSARRVEVCGA